MGEANTTGNMHSCAAVWHRDAISTAACPPRGSGRLRPRYEPPRRLSHASQSPLSCFQRTCPTLQVHARRTWPELAVNSRTSPPLPQTWQLVHDAACKTHVHHPLSAAPPAAAPPAWPPTACMANAPAWTAGTSCAAAAAPQGRHVRVPAVWCRPNDGRGAGSDYEASPTAG